MKPPGVAKADCLIAADIANTLKAMYTAEGKTDMAARFAGFDWKTEEDAFNDGFRVAGTPARRRSTARAATPGTSRPMRACARPGNNGVQLPIKEYKDGKLVGTEMLYMDGKFSTADGKAIFKPSTWPGLPQTVADQKAKHRFWINNGRVNEVWQTGYHDMYNAFVRDRWPMAFVEINPDDAQSMGVSSGDVIELFNDYGSTYAMAYLEPSTKKNQTFMQFGYWNGIAGDVVTPWTDRTSSRTTREHGRAFAGSEPWLISRTA